MEEAVCAQYFLILITYFRHEHHVTVAQVKM